MNAWIRSAPATYVYLFTLCVTTWVLQTASGATAHRLLLEQSTNLDRLEHGSVRVLVASAFWLPHAWELAAWAALFTLVLAPAERWLGAARFVLTFAAGHVGATLVTAALLWLAIHWQFVAARLGRVQDVGPSYGFFAVAAAFTLHMSGRTRVLATIALWTSVLVGYYASEGLSTAGHAVAVLIGYALALAYGRPITGRRGSWPSATSAAIPARGSPSRPSQTK